MDNFSGPKVSILNNQLPIALMLPAKFVNLLQFLNFLNLEVVEKYFILLNQFFCADKMVLIYLFLEQKIIVPAKTQLWSSSLRQSIPIA
jgi:hypothetical protein